MKTALLDVNVLLALFDLDHVHHSSVRRWFMARSGVHWATCPITQNGFIRVISQPKYPQAIPTAQAVSLLQSAVNQPEAVFWEADVSLLDPQVLETRHLLGHRQVTDAYLLALAVRNDGCLATLDAAVSVQTVRGATREHLIIL